MPSANGKPLVLFVCKHNTGRSQMAEAFLRRFTGDDVEVASAGTVAADRADPGVVAAMAEMGMDISTARPKLLDPAIVSHADRIITMGCDVDGVSRVDDDWGIPDPKGQPIERVREIRDLVCRKAGTLLKRFCGRNLGRNNTRSSSSKSAGETTSSKSPVISFDPSRRSNPR